MIYILHFFKVFFKYLGSGKSVGSLRNVCTTFSWPDYLPDDIHDCLTSIVIYSTHSFLAIKVGVEGLVDFGIGKFQVPGQRVGVGP